ncbi:chalcone-flavanone isomerase-domain-containing protein [Syncephalastrum racemosum]|uniref:Chalcone-flavanone isomerase-domain-containing protein n=1 Tax=Syncephalastrum racemosum TaxID=13706 RepID=A0A1X2HG96_SYNRA|nr:chalcone-flavanone isomerase-domain-containing protein [Syncephalastrum racemosum]
MHRAFRLLHQLPRSTAPLRGTLALRAQPVVHKRSPLVWISAAAAAGYLGYETYRSPIFAEASYVGTVSEPNTMLNFPIYLNTDASWKRLVGLGVRQVSFLNINVYVLGLYMPAKDIESLKSFKQWKNFDKSEFLSKEDMAMSLLDQPVDVSIRIVPVRTTSSQHLRDGFTRSLLQRMRDQSADMTEDEEREIMQAIQVFKSYFPAAKVKKDTEFVFTKTRDDTLKMEFEGKEMGTVKNKWLAKNFVMGYLNPVQPASELARQDIASGFEKLLREQEQESEDTNKA